MSEDHITSTIANQVLFEVDGGGYPGGSFTRGLIQLINKADVEHRGLLRMGFPGYVDAVNLAQGYSTGVARLQKIAAAGAR